MLLTELFKATASFKVDRDTKDMLSTATKIGGRDLFFSAEFDPSEKEWWITFGKAHEVGIFGMTNDHKAIQVLNFVKRSIELLVNKHDPEVMAFSASGSRISIYRRMLQRFLSGYTIRERKRLDSVIFSILKKET